ncbi:MAG: S9 family peptidase [Opitutaceae bacterium]|nr:S9 family peptidase [Opitutaceae bacterium]
MYKLPSLILALCALTVGAAEKRPITHQDLWLMTRVGAPVVSPDGRQAVFTVTAPAYDAKDQASDLWIVPVDGSAAPRKLTHTKAGEGGVDWSPDSTRMVFTAKREGDEASQLYLLDLKAGGEARRLTDLTLGARSPQWSPDGARILFISDVYPGAVDEAANKQAAKERKDRKYNARAYEGFPIRHWDRWLDEKRARLFVLAVDGDAPTRDLLAGTALVAQAGFGGQVGNSGESFATAWTPDSQGVVFTATTNGHQAAYADVRHDLYVVDLKGGEPRRLNADSDSYDNPVFSPDGKALIASVHLDAPGRVYTLTRLAKFSWPANTEAREVLTGAFDRSAGKPVFSPDSSRLYFTAEDAGLEKIYTVAVAGGPVTLAHDPGTGVVTSLNAGLAGDRFQLVGGWESAVSPPEIYALDPASRSMRPLTTFNRDRAADLDLPPVEHFTFTNSGGRAIHSLVVRPAGFDPARKYPLVALLHGGPHSAWRDAWVLRWNYHLLAGRDYVLLLTNYTGSTGFGEAFAQAIQGDPLRTPGEEINQAVDEAVRRYTFIDGERLAAGGASYGGHLANWLQATTTRYRCLISHAGLVNLDTQWGVSDVIYSRELNNGGPVWEQGSVWREQNPARLAGNHAKGTGWRTPMLITMGEQDFRVPLPNALENWSYHQRLQVPSKLIVFPDENHWILKGENSRYWYGEVHAWLARWLKSAQ